MKIKHVLALLLAGVLATTGGCAVKTNKDGGTKLITFVFEVHDVRNFENVPGITLNGQILLLEMGPGDEVRINGQSAPDAFPLKFSEVRSPYRQKVLVGVGATATLRAEFTGIIRPHQQVSCHVEDIRESLIDGPTQTGEHSALTTNDETVAAWCEYHH